MSLSYSFSVDSSDADSNEGVGNCSMTVAGAKCSQKLAGTYCGKRVYEIATVDSPLAGVSLMKEARLQDQELEQQEQQRLQDILNMCADYERQLVIEKQQIVSQQTTKVPHIGIKTNGSLPRDTPPIKLSASSSENMSSPADSSVKQFGRSTSSEDEIFFNQNSGATGNQALNESHEKLPNSSRPDIFLTRTGIKTVASNPKNCEVIEVKPKAYSEQNVKNTNSIHQQYNKNELEKSTSSHSEETGVYLSLTKHKMPHEMSKKDQLKQLKCMKCETENYISQLRNKIKEAEAQESEMLSEVRVKESSVMVWAAISWFFAVPIITLKKKVIAHRYEKTITVLVWSMYEMEKALLEAEKQTQLSDIMDDENRLEEIKLQENELFDDSSENLRVKNEDLIEKSRDQLNLLEKIMLETNNKIEQCEENGYDTEEIEELKKFLVRTQENIEAEKKIFEDLEFQKLEHEAHREEERETLQHRLNIEKDIIMERIKLKKTQLKEIELQQLHFTELVRSDTSNLERTRQNHLKEYRKEKLKFLTILKRINELVENQEYEDSAESSGDRSSDDDDGNMDNDEHLNKRLAELRIEDVSKMQNSHKSDDILISKVVGDLSMSPENHHARTTATLLGIERNRQSILDKQGSRVLEEERTRVQKLKKRVSDEVRSQWEENRRQREADCIGMHSNDSDEETYSLTSSELPTDTPSSGDENIASQSPAILVTPEIHYYDGCQDMNANGNTADPFEAVKRREKARSQRPLTRYLPIRQNNFNLKQHIETAGHQLDICQDHIGLSSHSCRGYLHKLGRKLRGWKKRWFVFDRNRRALLYFRDKSESKARRVMYFQDIEEVYVDHQNRVKSPHANMTFCVKTIDRLYFLVAPSPEAMRIWIDVIFTGAEGYQEFMLDMDL
ncbi:Pleckstrin y-like domain family B member 2 [Nymphon striatum]|nr:Pleckstrin y-like domain family B member 2 [Nymphon striatum]